MNDKHTNIGGDWIDAQGTQGFINRPSGDIHQHWGNVYEADEKYDVRGLENPYLGLRSFTYKDQSIYAGRERSITTALEKLTTPGEPRVLLFITGASGSGKSSLAQAGIVPALEHHYQQRHITPRYAVFRPSKYPLAMIADALRQLGMPGTTLDNQPDTFFSFVQQHTHKNQVNLLVIDQFEELFTQSEPAQRDTLVAILEHRPSFDQLRTHLIITLRSDYLPKLFEYQPLYEKCKQGLEVRVMTEEELREAIQRPIQQSYPDGSKQIEEALLESLAQDSTVSAAYLPLLQVTLEDLWKRGSLTQSAYGTLTDAIRRRAEEVYHFVDYDRERTIERPAPDKQTILALFLDLVEVSLDDAPRRDVRRRRTATDLYRGNAERVSLVEDLCRARLLSKDVETHDDQHIEVVDIIHETLIANWDRLRNAIADQRTALQQRVRFELALSEWLAHKQHEHYLLAGVRLAEAQALDERSDVALHGNEAQELLKRSVARREAERIRRLRQIQAVAVILLMLLLLASGAAIYAFRQQKLAQKQEFRALALAFASTAKTIQDTNDETVLALAAVRMDNETPETRNLAAETLSEYGLQYELRKSYIEAFSSDGHYVLSRNVEGILQLWDVTEGNNVITYTKTESDIKSVTFSPDGQFILVGLDNGTIHLWNVTNGEQIRTFEGHNDLITSLAFSPDGQYALSGSWDKTVRLWSVASGEQIQILTIDDFGRVSDVAFSPDGKYALFTFGDRSQGLYLWNVSNDEEVYTFKGPTIGHAGITFSPDGKYILSGAVNIVAQGDPDNKMRLWDVKTGTIVRVFSGHNGDVNSVAFSPDGQYALSGSDDRTVRLWDIATGQQIRVITIHSDFVHDVAFSSDGQYVFSSAGDVFRVCDITKDEQVRIFAGQVDKVRSVAFSPDGRFAISGSCVSNQFPCQKATIWLWDVTTGKQIRSFEGTEGDDVVDVAFSSDSQSVIYTFMGFFNSLGLHIIHWDIETGNQLYSSSITEEDFISLSLDEQMALVNPGGSLQLWSLVAFSPDGQMALVPSGGSLQLWDTVTDEQLRVLGDNVDGRRSFGFSPDGQMALSINGAELQLWDIATGNSLHVFSGHENDVTDFAFSPDGQFILSGAKDNTIRMWDIANGGQVRIFDGHEDIVSSVTFSPDGQYALSGSEDGTLRLWDARSVDEIADDICNNYYIVPESEDAMREEYGIPANVALCP